jgi:hypothetical protein
LAVEKLALVMPGQHAADEQQRQRLRHRHQDEVQAQAQVRQQDHRPAAEAVRQRALDRRAHELHDHEHRGEDAVRLRRQRHVAAVEAGDQVRQHRDDHPEGQDVQQHGDEDEGERGAAHGLQRRGGGGVVVVQGGSRAEGPPV